jgi:DNA ligase-1
MVKALAKIYDKKQKDVKKHCSFNTFMNIVSCYEAGETPSVELTVGVYVAPMLAKAVPKSKWPRNKLVEYKYDGARYQIHRDNDNIIIFNRKGVIVTHQFPDIVEKVASWEISPFIIDTEIYPINDDNSPAKFQLMNARFHSKDATEGVRKCPCALAIFDCLLYRQHGLIDTPLKDRLKFIEKFPDQAVRVVNPENSIPFYSEATSKGYEGIMVKDLNAPYESGKRSISWAKYKPPRIELDVVITGARYGDGKRSHVFASFDIAVSDSDGGYISIGSLGTGFADRDFMSLTQQLKPLVSRFEKGTHIIPPRIVLQITGDLVTTNEQGRYGIRFPRMTRIRNDKNVSEINNIDDVKEMM